MKVLMVLIAAVGMAACNPLTTDPVSLWRIDQTAVAYDGPDASWLRVAVDGVPRHAVRTRLSVVDEDGRRVGDLQPGVLGP